MISQDGRHTEPQKKLILPQIILPNASTNSRPAEDSRMIDGARMILRTRIRTQRSQPTNILPANGILQRGSAITARRRLGREYLTFLTGQNDSQDGKDTRASRKLFCPQNYSASNAISAITPQESWQNRFERAGMISDGTHSGGREIILPFQNYSCLKRYQNITPARKTAEILDDGQNDSSGRKDTRSAPRKY